MTIREAIAKLNKQCNVFAWLRFVIMRVLGEAELVGVQYTDLLGLWGIDVSNWDDDPYDDLADALREIVPADEIERLIREALDEAGGQP